jgi:ubiquinone/menaquinone biosynthesis C-methylase UbiE
LLELAAVQPGDVVLEIAAGLGELSRVLAERTSPGGRVIGTDLSPQMVQRAGRRTGDLDHLSFKVIDAQQMELADDSIDVVVCKMGLRGLPLGRG